ncbi:MAG TPA: ABC transporter ATP-binding protein [Phycisphaerales bacterium]|nr:ABC transporter ATP-binding protein [Phycisphaerales bacterium]HMP36662.1 ABC transporter ATP-binding protein [Phycisphaerales bacterium]
MWKSFGPLTVLRGLDLAVPREKVTVVLGASGCGKSVMLKLIVGLIAPDRGAVYFDGSRVDGLSDARLVPIRRQIGFLFQQSALFDSMTVVENVAFPLIEHTGLSAAARAQRVREVLEMVGLADAESKMPAELSGGQRKRIALARAIVLQPRLILYDEPTTGLDPIRSDVINELILRLQRTLHVTGIVVTHDLASAFKIADRMVMLHEGKVRLEGTPEELQASRDPVVRAFLRGESGLDDLEEIAAGAEPGVRGAS